MKENISRNPGLVNEIRNLIEQARSQVAATVNTELSMLY